MDYSQFTDEQLKERIKQACIHIEILQQQETDMMLELDNRGAINLNFGLPKFQKSIQKFINSHS